MHIRHFSRKFDNFFDSLFQTESPESAELEVVPTATVVFPTVIPLDQSSESDGQHDDPDVSAATVVSTATAAAVTVASSGGPPQLTQLPIGNKE